jgi:hypothetical protein
MKKAYLLIWPLVIAGAVLIWGVVRLAHFFSGGVRPAARGSNTPHITGVSPNERVPPPGGKLLNTDGKDIRKPGLDLLLTAILALPENGQLSLTKDQAEALKGVLSDLDENDRILSYSLIKVKESLTANQMRFLDSYRARGLLTEARTRAIADKLRRYVGARAGRSVDVPRDFTFAGIPSGHIIMLLLLDFDVMEKDVRLRLSHRQKQQIAPHIIFFAENVRISANLERIRTILNPEQRRFVDERTSSLRTDGLSFEEIRRRLELRIGKIPGRL